MRLYQCFESDFAPLRENYFSEEGSDKSCHASGSLSCPSCPKKDQKLYNKYELMNCFLNKSIKMNIN
ncbi:MAG: hypothetical protein VSS75_032225, partial [Candidatus Parabeggiatoa sp.]|nr:hypothetical protein [Candidatus Parabeggiatoa sp.]